MKLHIGEKIKLRADDLRIGPTELAELVNTSKQNIYGIFRRESIDTDLLRKLSKSLRLDFFSYYYDEKLPIVEEDKDNYIVKYRTIPDPLIEENKALKKELNDLKVSYEYLKKLYDLTEQKLPVKGKTSKKKKPRSG